MSKINYETISTLCEGKSKQEIIIVLASSLAALQRRSPIPVETVLGSIEFAFEEIKELGLS
jgi:hypothetical protein